MVDNKHLKEYNLKNFLYNFIIIWNILIIFLLIWLNFFVHPWRVVNPKPVKKTKIISGQFKFIWQSKNEFQDIAADIFYIDFIKSNSDKIKDFLGISASGMLICLDGENGNKLFQVETAPCQTEFVMDANKILLGSTDGNINAYTVQGKKSWNTLLESSINHLNNNVVLGTTNIYLLDRKGKVNNKFHFIKNHFIGRLVQAHFNDDTKADYIISERNYLRCLDGATLNQLWQREIPFIYSGHPNVIFDKNNDLFILLPLYSGNIKVLNKHGVDVFNIEINENLINQPVVFKNKHYMFVQKSLNNNIYVFDFEKRRNLWSLDFTENINDIKAVDYNYDNVNELFVLTELGKVYILNSENGKMIDYYHILENKEEKAVSSLGLAEVDNDNNLEFSFATDKGNVYLYKYVLFNKKFIFKKYIRYFKSKWKSLKKN